MSSEQPSLSPAYPREPVGYGRHPPHAAWPGKARIALQFVLNYEEGVPASLNAPKMMRVGMHCRLLGRPGRITALQSFLDYIEKYDHVWTCRRIEIARHWQQMHPPNARHCRTR